MLFAYLLVRGSSDVHCNIYLSTVYLMFLIVQGYVLS